MTTMNDEVCIAVAGNVDSGKSTTISVLKYDNLDDGNGSARQKIAIHPHEKITGRTSDISIRSLTKPNTDKEIVLLDLCGHEKYFRQTMFGLSGYFPDYGVLMISANNGIQKMTMEHMGVLLYMGIPFVIIISRMDLVLDNKKIYNETINNIKRFAKQFNKKIVPINGLDDFKLSVDEIKEKESQKEYQMKLDTLTNRMENNSKLIPIINISNKTGQFVNTVRNLLFQLKPRDTWNMNISGTIFYIDTSFNPPGIGLVISGVVKGDTIKVGDEMVIGPYNNDFVPFKVKSIHGNYHNELDELPHKHRGCLAIRILTKKVNLTRLKINRIKGMIAVTKNAAMSNVCYEFHASVTILKHPTTIRNNYCSMIYCGTVRCSAKICLPEGKHLKMGDNEEVKFIFEKPQFMEIGSRLFFTEKNTRGYGDVTAITPLSRGL